MSYPNPLQIYVAAVEAKNFSQVAHQMGLTPSAVSKQISQLETRLGVRLLHRTTRSISPTEAGILYYERCKRMLEELEETEQMIKDLDQSPRGLLRVWVPSIFGRSMLARVVDDFCRAYPNIQVDLLISDAPMDLVSTGYDVGIHLGDLPDSRLVARTMGPFNLVLCATPQYLAQNGHPHSLNDLASHELIIVSGNEFADLRKVKNLARAAKLMERPMRFATNDLDLAYHATLTGLGIAALPFYLIQRHLESGRLIHVLPEFETPSQNVHIIYNQPRYLSQKTKEFIHFITRYFIEREAELRARIARYLANQTSVDGT
ncbi:MAG: LysR family transcriptional regulator [Ketobacteraceae bacterium]|nr:LysR family transcriptional regulator [Ketobacteraceae bacterium]